MSILIEVIITALLSFFMATGEVKSEVSKDKVSMEKITFAKSEKCD
ncbi:hypothetical protein [Salinimicrobium oceani]|nr:hypothetical protein [Salinimicrobium oceani]